MNICPPDTYRQNHQLILNSLVHFTPHDLEHLDRLVSKGMGLDILAEN